MGLRFFRRIKIAPGISLNVSKSGISTSIGPKGAKVTIGPKGIRRTVGIPGTGIYDTKQFSFKDSPTVSPHEIKHESSSIVRGFAIFWGIVFVLPGILALITWTHLNSAGWVLLFLGAYILYRQFRRSRNEENTK